MSRIVMTPDEGEDFIDYLNRGGAVCNQCGTMMDRLEDPNGGCDIFVCPDCGWEIDEAEYEYQPDGEDAEWTPGMRAILGDNAPPAGCLACGGPYPDCKNACKLFDK